MPFLFEADMPGDQIAAHVASQERRSSENPHPEEAELHEFGQEVAKLYFERFGHEGMGVLLTMAGNRLENHPDLGQYRSFSIGITAAERLPDRTPAD